MLLRPQTWGGLHQGVWRVLVLSLPIFFNPFSRFNFEPDKAALFRALTLILLLTYLLSLPRHRLQFKPSLIAGLTVALWVLVTLATVFSIEPGRSFWGEARWGQGWLTLSGFYLIFGLSFSGLRDPSDREALVDGLLFASLPVCVYGIVQRLGIDPLTVVPPWERIQSTLPHANALGGYLVMVIPFTLYRWLNEKGRQRWLWAGLGALQLACLLLTFSRSSWLAALGTGWGVLVFWTWKTRQRTLTRLLLIGALAGLGVLVGLSLLPTASPDSPSWWQALSSLFRTSSPTVQIRLLAWSSILKAILARPILGYGPETLELALPRYLPPRMAFYGNLKAIAGRGHNELLELALFAGIPAALVYVGLLSLTIRKGWLKLKSGDPLALPLLAGLSAAVIHHSVDVATITSSCFFWLFLGMLIAPSVEAAADNPAEPQLKSTAVRLALIVVTIAGIGVVSVRPIAADVVGREGMALVTIQSWEDAETTLERAERLDPRPYAFTSLQAELTFSRMESENTIDPAMLANIADRLESALEHTPTDVGLWRQLIEMRRLQAFELEPDFWPEAYAACESLLMVTPSDPDSYMLCGDLRLWARQPADALLYYQTAADLVPGHYQPYYNLATVYRWLGDVELADQYAALAEEKHASWETTLRQR